MDLKIDARKALVTASSGGIGQSIAQSLAREGAVVYVNGRTASSVDKAMKAIGEAVPEARLEALVADNGTAEGCAKTLESVPEVDILVNNLGIYEAVDFWDTDDEAWQRIWDINIMSGVRLSRHYLKGMIARNEGRVVFISSESGVFPAPEMAHYSATKTTQLSLSRSLAELTKGTKVTVNAVLPGPTRTDTVEAFMGDFYPDLSPAEAQARFIEENRPTSLIQRLIEADEIGDIVAFICSPRAGVINGANILAEGGLVRSVF